MLAPITQRLSAWVPVKCLLFPFFQGEKLRKLAGKLCRPYCLLRGPCRDEAALFLPWTLLQGPFAEAQQAVWGGHCWGAAQLPRAPCFPSLRLSASFEG